MVITVEFRRTGSRDLARALELARAHPSFSSSPPPVRFTVRYSQDELDAFEALVAIVGRWSQTRLMLGGQPVEWRRLAHLLNCYRARLATADRAGYCQGREVHETKVGAARQLFPCRLIPISESNHHGWFQYGRLSRDGVFLVDKGLLRQTVRDAAERTLADRCPAFFPAEVDAVIDRLPDRIQPSRDGRWTYREGWVNGRFSPVGVEKRTAPAPVARTPRAARPDRAQGDAEGSPGAGPEEDAARVPAGVAGPAPPSPRPAVPDQGAARAPGAAPPRAAESRNVPAVRYRDVGGLSSQLRVVRENLELPLRYPELFAHVGVEPHRGLLLAGPPGTGKTLMAKALATECSAHFCLVNGPEIISKWHGESEANLRRIFDEARLLAPAVVLIDEIDSIAPDRSRVTHNHEAVLVSQLLTLLDGLTDRGSVVVVATTNRPESVDPALRRPGRLDLVLHIGLPDTPAREEILGIHTGRMPLHADVDIADLARRTDGFSGAHLSSLCREAGLECMREVLQFTGEGEFVLPPDALDGLCVKHAHFERALPTVAPAQP